jgi:hypothetical protein
MRKPTIGKWIFVASLCVAGGVMSQKVPKNVILSRTLQNHSTLMTLKWESEPGHRYAVETSDQLQGWITIASNLMDVGGVGKIEYTIPDEYVFDPKRFFRVRVELSE